MNSPFNTNIYKLNIFEYVCREVRNWIDFAYHFINSTVHTSRVIWALKTVKVNECLFTDEKQHGYMEQRLSLLAESWSTPTRVACVAPLEAEHWSRTWFTSFTFHRSAHRWGPMRPTRQRGQINTSNTAQSCLQRSTGTRHPLQTLFENKVLFEIWWMHGGSKNIWHCSQNYSQVNKTFGTKYMYRNAKWNKTAIFSFHVTNFIQFAFL